MFAIVAITSLAAFAWLLFHLATLALPLFVGMAAAVLAHRTGAGLLGAGAIGFIVGVLTLAAGRLLLDQARSPVLRGAVTFLFAAPATIAGFSMVQRLATGTGATEPWALVFGALGAAVTGMVAVAKVNALAPGGPGRAARSARPPRQAVVGVADDC